MDATGKEIQIDNGGYGRLHHLVFEALIEAHLTMREMVCLLFLLKKTYGWNKKQDKISLSQWSDGTFIDKRNLQKTLKGLLEKKVIYKVESSKSGRSHTDTWGFNKYVEQWNVSWKGTAPSTEKESLQTTFNDKEKESLQTPFLVNNNSEKESLQTTEKESLQTPTEEYKAIAEASQEKSLLANESDDAKSLLKICYQTVSKFGPNLQTEHGKEILATACELVETYGFDSCFSKISTLAERNKAMIHQGKKQGISAPVAYLKTLMESDSTITVKATSTLDFALEEIN